MEHFTKAQRKKINKSALAVKHDCTATYITLVLKGEREDKSELAKAILLDAKNMLEIFEPNQES
ncbi:MAG: hypothetical protein PSX42_11150 [bacterium]|nr:hypothetical protein [bacterium]